MCISGHNIFVVGLQQCRTSLIRWDVQDSPYICRQFDIEEILGAWLEAGLGDRARQTRGDNSSHAQEFGIPDPAHPGTIIFATGSAACYSQSMSPIIVWPHKALARGEKSSWDR